MKRAPLQKNVLERLETQIRREMRNLERASIAGLEQLWNKAKDNIKASLIMQYKTAAPTGRWELAHAKATGAIYRMEKSIMVHMDDFKHKAKIYIHDELNKHYDHEYHTAAYVLDQVTPPCCPVKIKPRMREASVNNAPGAWAKWWTRFDGWANAWESALKQNITLNAINSGLVDDVIAEVDATRMGTPAITFWDAQGRLFLSELLRIQAEARGDMAALNDDLIAEEIWQTMEDERVCGQCGPNDGQLRSEIEEEPPLHPNCRCFYRIMPKDWIELSRADWETAHALDVMDAVPDGMYIRNPETGEIDGAVVVSFSEWAQDKLTLSGK